MRKLLSITFFILMSFCAATASTSPAQKASPHTVRRDEALVSLYYEHQESLKNLEVDNHPMIVCFSGTPGMGKTTITKSLEERYSAVVISSDKIRELVRKHAPNEEQIDKKYFYFLIDHLPKKNGMIILDMSIDRTYKDFLPWASKNKLPVFIIQLGLSKDETIKRIKSRGVGASEILSHINKNFEDYDEFQMNVGIDYYLDNSTEPNLKKLYKLIDKRIHKEHGDAPLVDQLKRVLTQEKLNQ